MHQSAKFPDGVLGLDIGRVIVAPADGNTTGSLFDADEVVAASAPANEGVFTVLPSLVRAFRGRVWLVSKASKPMQIRTRAWLVQHRFFERTGIPPGQLVFCFHRDEKAGICQSLGVTHFVDDRLDILVSMEGIVARRYWFTTDPDDARGAPPGIKLVQSWQQSNLVKMLTKGVGR